MRSRFTFIGAVAASLTLSEAAFALPTVTTDRECYAAGADVMTFAGQGYTPGAGIAFLFAHNGKIGSFTTIADATGAFTTKLNAPELDDFGETAGAFDLSFTANDQTKSGPEGPIGSPEEFAAFGEVRISEWMVDIPALNRAATKVVKPGRKLKVVTTGWTSAGDTLYVHYLRGRKAAHSEKIGALKGPCGDLTATRRMFTFESAKPGRYGIRFSASSKWNANGPWLGYPEVRLAA
jgi:hypothetical protein